MKYAVIGQSFECVLAVGATQAEAMTRYNQVVDNLELDRAYPEDFETSIKGKFDCDGLYVLPCDDKIYEYTSKGEITFFTIQDGEVTYNLSY